ncbi:TetR family transcriptional regulator C-terminal domain-containing protein [Micromonospora sp. PLK6-60]|uniref:TetR/AcrR family transcriptional regulator n=1 Tax=Micromonospora sp. PLK6-60 TaxID=2873383 RepID=UPI001CA72A9E|nr:TetR family transcriptional regulator C-terminal domain-containing protein [Micromonospora sp. PLK6-60]MBY8871688.1 TetR family transcriptional regulator C-terminal domain-containing protein [Micromonospora sp. PLK6-60]
MPKIVNRDERRAELAEALWQVVYRDGVAAATVRSVAAEAGWSPGALRHYFATQGELLAFAMEHVIARATERLTARSWPGSVREAVRQLLEEVLPLDRQRTREAEVWLMLAARTRTDPETGTLMREADDGVRRVCASAIGALAADGLVAPGREPDLETARLHALLDGLTLHALLHPDLMPPERVRALLADHLDGLRHERRA